MTEAVLGYSAACHERGRTRPSRMEAGGMSYFLAFRHRKTCGFPRETSGISLSHGLVFLGPLLATKPALLATASGNQNPSCQLSVQRPRQLHGPFAEAVRLPSPVRRQRLAGPPLRPAQGRMGGEGLRLLPVNSGSLPKAVMVMPKILSLRLELFHIFQHECGKIRNHERSLWKTMRPCGGRRSPS